MNKSFYFRKSSTLTADDDNDNSLILPVDRVHSITSTTNFVIFYFKHLIDFPEEFNVNSNNVVLYVSSGTGKTIMESIVREVNTGEESIVTVFDAVTGDKVDNNISSVLQINIDEG
tara:strand:- start:1476 stop:1823 length:348 start_codon:yes stop_codon:yes gene_type:complete